MPASAWIAVGVVFGLETLLVATALVLRRGHPRREGIDPPLLRRARDAAFHTWLEGAGVVFSVLWLGGVELSHALFWALVTSTVGLTSALLLAFVAVHRRRHGHGHGHERGV